MRTTITLATALAAALSLAGGTAAGGVGGPAFWVDGVQYRTVATPTDLSGTGAPAHAWDTIYEFGGTQLNVATAAPGDRDYNGGRWQVLALAFPSGYAAALAAGDANANGAIDSDAELDAAILAGKATVGGVVKQFVCPVIKLRA